MRNHKASSETRPFTTRLSWNTLLTSTCAQHRKGAVLHVFPGLGDGVFGGTARAHDATGHPMHNVHQLRCANRWLGLLHSRLFAWLHAGILLSLKCRLPFVLSNLLPMLKVRLSVISAFLTSCAVHVRQDRLTSLVQWCS